MAATDESGIVFQERLGPGFGLWAAGVVVIGAVAIAYGAMLGRNAAFLMALLGVGVLIGISLAFNRKTTLTGSALAVGSQSLSLDHVTGAEPLDPERARAQAGPEADARAQFILRTGKPAVKVLTDDQRCPYWLISTSRPEELATAISQLMERRAPGPGTMGA